MEKYNKLLRNITELIEKGLFSSKDLKKEVEEALINNGLKIGNVIKRPIDGLVAHHKRLLDTSYI